MNKKSLLTVALLSASAVVVGTVFGMIQKPNDETQEVKAAEKNVTEATRKRIEAEAACTMSKKVGDAKAQQTKVCRMAEHKRIQEKWVKEDLADAKKKAQAEAERARAVVTK